MRRLIILLIIMFIMVFQIEASEKVKIESEVEDSIWKSEIYKGLKLRGIGPAVYSGRVSDFAVDPNNYSTYYVAVASGGVWKTTNAGTTWEPIFDEQGSYSIGCVTLDPKNPLVVWVGTGENNSQRSVGYGDGVYKSIDGGKNWESMGLKNSEHIGKILIDPRDANVVYVAAQGPLWNSGGDRGLFKSTDGGRTWRHSLKISDNTGVSDVVMDMENPDILFAAAYQRRRHVWTLIDGGPESAIYKSTDAGQTWTKLTNGLPKGDIGRIGLAISPVNHKVIYAIIEAADDESGFYRSTDGGGNWEKMSNYVSQSPQYYQEIIADPKNVDRVYSMDTWMMVTNDGGKTFQKVGERYKHVDNHALWIEPSNPDHLLAGCDGGIYESWDRGATWDFKPNLPIMQFYRVSVDNSLPFYYVYGGTQDNQTVGGPSRTTTAHGIVNSDWYTTVGGDGFYIQVDPKDPNIIYCEWQYGGLVRYDKRNGELIDIKPQPESGEVEYRFNWDAPLLLSPHSNTRIYFAANKLFRSDDRGNTWKIISPDLTRQLDRNKLKVMGRIWSVDSVAKNASTSYYGNITALDESPLKEGLIYVGTDDGLIQISEDGGLNWRKIEKFPNVPEMTYVSKVLASLHDVDTVYAAFDNHKMGDYKPYLLKSRDRGRTWVSIAGNLPRRGNIYTIVQDHIKPELLFVGTEFGLFFTPDEGKHWIQLKGNFPTIAVRDLVIQRRENDLVVGTFGRGIYILDNYTPLRLISEEMLKKEAVLFPVKDAWMFIPREPLGLKDKAFQGDSFYAAPNPPFGAVFTYYLKDSLKTKKQIRRELEKKLQKEGKDTFYPSWDGLYKEDREDKPAIILVVMDNEGNVVRRLIGPTEKGFHRVAWNLRFPSYEPVELKEPERDDPFESEPIGPKVVPGDYKVVLFKREGGKLTQLSEPQIFKVNSLGASSLPEPDKKELLKFEKKTANLQRAVLAAIKISNDTKSRLELIKKALDETPAADPTWIEETLNLMNKLKDLQIKLKGDPILRKYNEPAPMSIVERVENVISGHWTTTTAPTNTHIKAYEIAAEEFEKVLNELYNLVEIDLKKLEEKAEIVGAPYTPGRFPKWKKE